MDHPNVASRRREVGRLILAIAFFLGLGALLVSRGFGAGIEGGVLRPGTVTVVTFSKLRGFRSDADSHRRFDLDAAADSFASYVGEHAPRVYRARWEGWTPSGWRQYEATFEVNGPTVILPLWRADGAARIVYLNDHMSERRWWGGASG